MLVYQWNDVQWQESGELEQEDATLPAMRGIPRHLLLFQLSGDMEYLDYRTDIGGAGQWQ